MNSTKNFFQKLFDLSFSEFITLRVLGFIFALGIGTNGLFCVIRIANAFYPGGSEQVNLEAGIGAIVLYTFVFLILTVILRVFLELVAASIRTAINSSKLVEKTYILDKPKD